MKYVFFDVDGTVWDENMIVPESTKRAIKELQANGHKAFVCTGRAMGTVCDPQFDEIGFDGYVASCGNHVEMNGEVIYERLMSQEDVELVFEASRKYRLPIIYEGSKYQWLDSTGFEGDTYISYIVEKLADTAIYLDDCNLTDIEANKFSALVRQDTDYEAIKKVFDGKYVILEHGEGVIEAIPIGTSKATGIQKLCEHLGVSIEDTFGFGDSINDIEMLQFVGHSIAMGNASQIAKDAAEYVTSHIKEDGILNGLKHYGLID